jgi:hypothetical protein
VKGEAAALSVRAQRCQSHYFSATPRIFISFKLLLQNSFEGMEEVVETSARTTDIVSIIAPGNFTVDW